MIGDYDRLKAELLIIIIIYIIFFPITIPISIYFALAKEPYPPPAPPLKPIVETEENRLKREARASKFKFYRNNIKKKDIEIGDL